ncbi:polysaccharide deacetylase [Spirochaetia bacterium]|nr:polysaccharide deacetylase [Spirochaetia bacterium]
MYTHSPLKALTFSYDDGTEYDRRLVEILNRYGMKAAFNLNSGLLSGAGGWEQNGVPIRRMNVKGLPELYAGHEIAVHSLTHPRLETLDAGTVLNELEQDKLNLERIFHAPVCGMAYPYGSYNETVVNIIRQVGLRYARGTVSTHSFDIPVNLLTYQPTCHHKDSELMNLAEQFIRLKPDVPQVFYLWGHSYEFEVNNNWQILEDFCALIAGRDDIAYVTNAQAFLGEQP